MGCAGLSTGSEAGFKAQRRFYTLPGLGVGPPVQVPKNDLGNAILAVSHRVLRYYDKTTGNLEPVIQPRAGAWTRMAPFVMTLAQLVRDTCPVKMTMTEFVDSCAAGVKKRYQEAKEDYLARGQTRKDGEVKVFVKFEKLVEKAGEMPIPRIISPRSPVYNLRLGMFLRPIEKSVFNSLHRLFASSLGSIEAPVTKGQTDVEKAGGLARRWGRFKRPVGIGADASKWDQHVSKDALATEHALYLLIYAHDKELAWLLRQQLANKCSGQFSDGWLKYKTDGKRMSGDMNTSLGNCLLSCLLILLFLLERGVKTAEVANDGDDLLVIMEDADLHLLGGMTDWYATFGFKMVVERPVYSLEECEFCSAHPVQVNETQWTMVRNLTALAKDAITLSAVSEREARDWMAAVGQCGLAVSHGIPMYDSLYRKLAKTGNACKAMRTKLWMNAARYEYSEGCNYVADEAIVRSSFFFAFGVSPDMQIAYETAVSELVEVSGVARELPGCITL